jgi:hypothetical protein
MLAPPHVLSNDLLYRTEVAERRIAVGRAKAAQLSTNELRALGYLQ